MKIGIVRGAGPWRTAFLSNLFLAVGMQVFAIRHGTLPIPWDQILWPLLAGASFFFGQITTFLAIQSGHISLVTPLLGSKVLLIAILSALVLRQPVPGSWWIGAVLALVGVAILGYQPTPRDKAQRPTNQLPTIAWGLLSALLYSATDLFVQDATRVMPPSAYLSVMFAFVGLLTFLMIPLFRSPLRAIPKAAWPWVIGGSALVAMQGLLMAVALAWFIKAAEANIVYNSRGLWTVLLSLILARRLGLGERLLNRTAMVRRAFGAVLLLAAIWVVV